MRCKVALYTYICVYIYICGMAHKGDITALKTYPDLNAVKCKGKNVPGTNININATVRCLADEDLGRWCHQR